MGMQKRIFVYKKITNDSEYDIYSGHNASQVIDLVNNVYHSCPNFGNKVWFQGIMSAVYSENAVFGFWDDEITPEHVNEHYDLVLLPMANIFNTIYKDYINSLAEFFSKIKIPTIIMSCGVQDDSYDKLDELISNIGETSKRFIYHIFDNGGKVGVRGEFTKLFFEKLGYKDVAVTGCPSIYQNGADLSITNEKISSEKFKYIVNGTVNSFKDLLENSNSVYIDQYSMFELLFMQPSDNQKIESLIKQYIKKYGLFTLKLASENRIQLFANPNDWRKYLIDNDFSFSFGSRIHGSVMSILSGLPTAMCPIDSRTMEMADFYKIPTVKKSELDNKSIYEIYSELDFSDFNKQYSINYKHYCDFLVDSGLTDKVNPNNIFFDDKKDYIIEKYPNADLLNEINKELNKNINKYKFIDKYYAARKQLVSFFR